MNLRTVAAAGVLLAAAVAPASAQTLRSELVVGGLTRPVFVTHAPGDFDRIFIVEQRGSAGVANRADIKIFNLDTNTLNPTPFLSIAPVSTGSEQGLLGLAFHPDYANNGYFFVNYTNTAGATVIQRYQVSADPDVADAGSAMTVLTLAQPFSNHNGGWIAFGPDGYLYIGTGDGGSGGDPGNRAQDIENQLLGKMLRIDVDGDDFPGDANRNYAIPPDNPFVGVAGDDEIWAYGLRNPWRPSFDRETGDLYIADVGQNVWEEINFQPASSAGGENYGWRCYEGNANFNTAGCASPDTMVFPFHVYSHSLGCSITGGYVYRGCAIPELRGTYFFADYCTRRIWSTRYTGSPNPTVVERTTELDPPGSALISSITSFGEDAYGEIYICDGSSGTAGEVYRIVAAEPVGPDCNKNGRRDECDILDGSSADDNGDGIPDECQTCAADFNGDGELTPADFSAFRAAFLASDDRADFNGDGELTPADFSAFRAAFLAGCG